MGDDKLVQIRDVQKKKFKTHRLESASVFPDDHKEPKIKVGSIVMFVDQGIYAKWFFGQIGVVTAYKTADESSTGQAHCAINWYNQVKYFDRLVSTSHFSADKLEVMSE